MKEIKSILHEYSYIPIICGPTASGKSSLALNLCEKTQGELISCDSMQIYKYFDIGTAKATYQEQMQVKHHMIDIVEPDQSYSVNDYCNDCYKVIDSLLNQMKLPVICGGTGQYVKTLCEGIKYTNEEVDEAIVKDLYEEYEHNGIDDLYKRLEAVDSIAASKIHPNDTRRVIRALSLYIATGKTFTEWNNQSMTEGPKYPFKVFAIDMDRSILYDRINRRVDMMIEDGLLEEVDRILKMNIPTGSTSMQAIGYKEFIDYFNGSVTLDEAIYQIKLRSRHYAKRQLTWYRYMSNIIYLDFNDSTEQNIERILNEIK
ncbi:MAG: tRNA (adenosine(37)-N6)-dimethylallyltransferase MiaA [Clostridia bacterium]|nr:tRNA (adenosine(37)-N6)-dimethylallyltransferase MiaA [Clostridia bacterium]